MTDARSARLVSAIEAFAAAHDDIAVEKGESLAGAGHASLHTLLQDLHSAVDRNPGDVTQTLVRLTQSLVGSRSISPNVLLHEANSSIRDAEGSR